MLHIVSMSHDPASMKGSGDSRPADALLDAGLPDEVAEAFVVELDLVLQGESVEDLPPEAVTAEAAPVEAPVQLDAERWLAHLQGQREVQLAARDVQQAPAAGLAVQAGVEVAQQPSLEPERLSEDTMLQARVERGARESAPLERTPRPETAVTRFVAPEPAVTAPVPATTASQQGAPLSTIEAQSSLLTIASASDTAAADSTAPLSQPAREAGALHNTLKLPEAESRWGEKMLHALRETVDLQIQTRTQNATIRLDPPELGSLEIFLSHEKGRLSVQITSSQADVTRLLQQTSERLRLELTSQNLTQVSVEIFSEGQGGQRQSQQRAPWMTEDDGIIAANTTEQADAGHDRAAQRSSDILVTV